MQEVVALAWTGHASMGAASSTKCNRADVATQAADDRHEAELRLSARRAARNMDSRTPVHLLASRFSSDLLISGARIARENTPVVSLAFANSQEHAPPRIDTHQQECEQRKHQVVIAPPKTRAGFQTSVGTSPLQWILPVLQKDAFISIRKRSGH